MPSHTYPLPNALPKGTGRLCKNCSAEGTGSGTRGMPAPLLALIFSISQQTRSLGTSVLQSGRARAGHLAQRLPGWEGGAADSPRLLSLPPQPCRESTLWEGTSPDPSVHITASQPHRSGRGWKPERVNEREKDAHEWTFHPSLGPGWGWG